MKTLIITITFIVAIVTASSNKSASGNPTASKADNTPAYDMKKYWLVFLKKGPNRNQSKADSEKIQAAHLANITRLHEQGKIIMAGPIGNENDVLGIFIMDGKDSTQIASYVAGDSAVITGRLRFEILPWWTAKGKYEFK
ncbi:YciI family protein [Flavisolibacter tropicus]|uniref:YciI family protein n=1 Tax=Flavisolibacter tropicus TaxID=1492898 RepID=UPI0008355262|nr:hypothetical protein [Flavisolibacter tropicus]